MLRDGGAKVVGLDEAQAQLVILGGAELQQLFYQTFSSSELAVVVPRDGATAGAARRRHRRGGKEAERP